VHQLLHERCDKSEVVHRLVQGKFRSDFHRDRGGRLAVKAGALHKAENQKAENQNAENQKAENQNAEKE